MRGVLATSTVNGRLTVDGQIPKLVHLGQLLVDDRGLLGRRLAGPRERLELVPTELGKESCDIREAGNAGIGAWSAPGQRER